MPSPKLSARFVELIHQANGIETTKTHHPERDFSLAHDTVDADRLTGWKVKCRNLLANACGKDSEHYLRFAEIENPKPQRDNWHEMQQLKAVFLAAQEDYDGGYLDKLRVLIQAEVFSDELDQARVLLSASYSVPAAVVAGTVLETKLRDMCGNLGLPTGKLDKMNADLAKAGAYNLLVQKRITALADIRNSAAHGHPEKFSSDDVLDMIGYVERFLADF